MRNNQLALAALTAFIFMLGAGQGRADDQYWNGRRHFERHRHERDHDRRERWERDRGRPGIVLYRDIYYRGERYALDHGTPNVGRGFNDQASSARVNYGVWLLCQDAGFRGRCITIDRDAPSFVALGFNDQLTSVRRLR